MPQYRGRPPVTIDRPTGAFAESQIAALAQEVAAVELRLATLAGYSEGDLFAAIVGALGISAGEMREQIPALRQALRDLESDSPTPNTEVWI